MEIALEIQRKLLLQTIGNIYMYTKVFVHIHVYVEYGIWNVFVYGIYSLHLQTIGIVFVYTQM